MSTPPTTPADPAGPPTFRPVSATVWTVTAVMWGVLAIGYGLVRLHREWSDYRMWQDFLDRTDNGAGVVWGYAFDDGWPEITLLAMFAGIVWVGLTLVWIGLAAARFIGRPRPASVGAQLTTVVSLVVVAAVATAVLIHDDYAVPQLPSEARLLTPAFVCAVVLVLDGVVALALARWTLRDQVPISPQPS